MTCARARELIVELDAREAPGAELADHLRACDGCRGFHARLQRLEVSAGLGTEGSSRTAAGQSEPARADFTARVMRAVTTEPHPTRSPASADARDQRPVGLRGWTVGATLILAGLVSIEFSDVVAWLRGEFGSVIDVALGTMLGVALTVYILLLVGLNVRAVRRFLGLPIR